MSSLLPKQCLLIPWQHDLCQKNTKLQCAHFPEPNRAYELVMLTANPLNDGMYSKIVKSYTSFHQSSNRLRQNKSDDVSMTQARKGIWLYKIYNEPRMSPGLPRRAFSKPDRREHQQDAAVGCGGVGTTALSPVSINIILIKRWRTCNYNHIWPMPIYACPSYDVTPICTPMRRERDP